MVIGRFGVRVYHIPIMINLILAIALSSMNSPKVAKDISPCVWPKCMKTVEVAQIQGATALVYR